MKDEGYQYNLKGHGDVSSGEETGDEVFIYELEEEDVFGFGLYRDEGEVKAHVLDAKGTKPVI